MTTPAPQHPDVAIAADVREFTELAMAIMSALGTWGVRNAVPAGEPGHHQVQLAGREALTVAIAKMDELFQTVYRLRQTALDAGRLWDDDAMARSDRRAASGRRAAEHWCDWCPVPASPDPQCHPGGQRDHVPYRPGRDV
jgi:hypothetical protein